MAAPLSILLVDDDPLMHRMLVPRLEEIGFPVARVASARSPQEAITLLAELKAPLAVVSDFNLKAPITGFELLREVRAARPEAARVLFSGYSREQLGNEDRDGIVEKFLEKPLHLDDLVRPLREFLAARLPA